MTKIQKKARSFLERPARLRYADIERILLYLGFEIVPARGSHRKFKHPLLPHDLVIPVHGNDCKDFYKRQAAGAVRDIIKKMK